MLNLKPLIGEMSFKRETEWYAEFLEQARPMMDGAPNFRRFNRSVANAK